MRRAQPADVARDAALERLYREPERFGRDGRTGAELPFERLDLILLTTR